MNPLAVICRANLALVCSLGHAQYKTMGSVFGYFDCQTANFAGFSWAAPLIFSPLFFQSRGNRTSNRITDVSFSQALSVSLDILVILAEVLSGANAQLIMQGKISRENVTIMRCFKDMYYTSLRNPMPTQRFN
jgi:hypothetical protein